MNFLFGCIKEITYICINNRQIQATTLHIHYYIYANAPAPTTFTTMTTKELTRLTLSTVSTLVISLSSYAQEKSITLSFTPAQDAEGCNIYIKPLSVATSTDPVQMTQAGAAFTASVPASDVALYSITCIRNQSQTISTVSISGDAATLSLPVKFADNILVSDNTADNKALGAYAACATANDIRLWTDRNAGTEQLKALLQNYTAKADSVLSIYQCSPDISKYIQMWAYTSTYNAFTSLPNITGCKPDEMPFKAKDVMAKPDQILDSPMATLFPIAPALINNFLPRESSLMEQLDWLHSNFKCPDIIEQVGGAALDKFISRFDYAGNYEEGLAQLKEVTAKYKLDNRYVNKFISNRATIKGSPFPAGLTFTDTNGNTHTIDEFKGKYIYIDLWASWCGPCCKEVPHLQTLEKELQNPNVAFLSISIDSKPEPWKKKMADLNMHGNQWHDPQGLLGKNLNVMGIPFFVIYDKEGKLYMHNAPRPSHPQTKAMLEELK